jgi:hypothetical protein
MKKKNEGGTKHDSGKPRMELIPFEALEEVAKVYTFGADKYDEFNWRKGLTYNRLLGATLRHISKFINGTDCDKESNLNHLAHAISNLLMIISFHKDGRNDLDDRYKTPNN